LTFNNAGTWNFAGTETLTAGADAISNSGTINTVGTSKIDFGAGANTFSNAGTIKVGGAGAATAAASLTLSNLAVLNNSGVIDVHDGATNRSFTTTATLNGTGASQLYVDAALGGPGSTASAVTIGGSSGLTAIRVNNTNAGGVGAYIPDPANGIVLVTGATSLSNFRISELSDGYNGPGLPTGANGTIAAPGMFFYDLAANGNKIVLVSAPKVAAFQFAQIGAIAGDAWTTTTQSWFDRQADLRDTLGGRALGSAPAVWMKVVGDWSRRDSGSSLTVAGKTYGYDTSYKADTASVIAGVDLLHGSDKASAWVIGVQGGYVDANARFRNSSTRLNLTGGVVGVYASYL
ncbi:MAG: autotransporter domain-containing protein, partial [Proteobacteria bacterium]|nr:autotransporter domain-containing protein [Pseudomonadota bacterium]